MVRKSKQVVYNVIIKPEIFDDVALRTITETDCDNLRQWKNNNRKAFFFQNMISPQMQMKWFHSYWERENDFMFMVMFNTEPTETHQQDLRTLIGSERGPTSVLFLEKSLFLLS